MRKFIVWTIIVLLLVGISGLTAWYMVNSKDIPLSLLAMDIICFIGVALTFKERK